MTAGKAAPRKSMGRPQVGGVGISSAQRVIDAVSGVSKRELAEYYLGVAEWLVPQLRGRPLSLVRAPEGLAGETFFQRHCGRLKMPHMRLLDRALDPEHARLMQADSITAVIEAVQMGSIEFHTWKSMARISGTSATSASAWRHSPTIPGRTIARPARTSRRRFGSCRAPSNCRQPPRHDRP